MTGINQELAAYRLRLKMEAQVTAIIEEMMHAMQDDLHMTHDDAAEAVMHAVACGVLDDGVKDGFDTCTTVSDMVAACAAAVKRAEAAELERQTAEFNAREAEQA